MTYIEISDSKISKMSECVEEILNKGGELMWMLEKAEGGSGWGERSEGRSSRYGERGSYGNRYDYMDERGGRMGYRDEDDWEEEMQERRGRRRRDSRGRYM